MQSTTAVGETSPADDRALVLDAARGDANAFNLLVTSRIDRCYRLAFAILGEASDAVDATQEGLVTAWRELPRLRDPAAFDGWLNRIVANTARMSRRGRGRRREVRVASLMPGGDEDHVWEPADLRAAHEPESVATTDSIGRAFDRLAEPDRLILVLHHVEERPVAEIARSLGVPVGTAKWRLHQARTALKRAMEIER
jgi:RNA polymerase sigma-70 factor, ECF subfamily